MLTNYVSQLIEYVYMNTYSDLHLCAKTLPAIRKNTNIVYLNGNLITDEDVLSIYTTYCSQNIDRENKTKAYDFSFEYKDVRFRANLFHDKNGYNISLRLLKLFSTDFDVLGLPQVLKKVVDKQGGLILFTGPTGSGKSTSMAALVNYLNETESKHIITIEDPIEYVFESNKCLINQRQLNEDTISFEKSIVEALRQDPDIIIVGEMRDKKSIEAALSAAETGHIVLSTLHTRDAASTIFRIVEMFETDKQNQILSQLSSSLLCVLSQQLLPGSNQDRVYLATELLLANNAIKANIKANKIQMISNMITLGKSEGMYSMADSVKKLYQEGKISRESFDANNKLDFSS